MLQTRTCLGCNKVDNVKNMTWCEECKAVIYCTKTCLTNHYNTKHKIGCPYYKEWMKDTVESDNAFFEHGFTFTKNPVALNTHWHNINHNKGMWKRMCYCDKNPYGTYHNNLDNSNWGLGDKMYPDNQLTKPLTTLTNWKDYYMLRDLPLKSPVSALLHYAMTVFYLLQSQTDLLEKDSKYNKQVPLQIHLMGVQMEADLLLTFRELGYLLESVWPGGLSITMVGNELDKNINNKKVDVTNKTSVIFLVGKYHTVADKIENKPHIIIGLNAGLEETTTGNYDWEPTLEYIIDNYPTIPVFFSDYTRPSSFNACNLLNNSGFNLTLNMTLNPFRFPVRFQPESTTSAFLYSSNGYIFGKN